MHPNVEFLGCSGFSDNSGRLMENIVLLELKRARKEIPSMALCNEAK
jgi:predicted AAA+ superfamily ATPase